MPVQDADAHLVLPPLLHEAQQIRSYGFARAVAEHDDLAIVNGADFGQNLTVQPGRAIIRIGIAEQVDPITGLAQVLTAKLDFIQS
jgi:hypothetical protein